MAQPGRVIVKNIHSTAGNRPFLHLKQAHENVNRRCFPGTGGAHNTDGFTDGNPHAGIIQNLFRGIRVNVGNIIQTDGILYRNRGRFCIIFVLVFPVLDVYKRQFIYGSYIKIKILLIKLFFIYIYFLFFIIFSKLHVSKLRLQKTQYFLLLISNSFY